MTRVFGRGELKLALLQVTSEVGPANGYVIMHALAGRIGGSWQPSPGAIYPALLALEDAGLVSGVDETGGRLYRVTDAGRSALAGKPDVIGSVAARARHAPGAERRLGTVLDRLAAAAPHRDLVLDAEHERRIEDRFRSLLDDINPSTAKETP